MIGDIANASFAASTISHAAIAKAASNVKIKHDKPHDSLYDTNDMVEITGKARDLLDASRVRQEIDSNAPAMRAERKAKLSYTKDDLAQVKERFTNLRQMQVDIDSSLKSILSANKIKLRGGDRVKIEIDSKGKAIVGGIEDAKTAKKVEQAVNADTTLMAAINKAQKFEAGISRDLKALTGMSLRDYKIRIDTLQKDGGMDTMRNDLPDGRMYSKSELIGLKDQDIYLVDEEFATSISDYYAVNLREYDYSSGNNILEDANTTVNSVMQDAIGKINAAFKRVNEKTREQYGDTLSEEELAGLMLSLAKVDIAVGSKGEISINGEIASDSQKNNAAKKIIESILTENIKDNPVTGEKSGMSIASEYLLNQYEQGYDDSDTSVELVTTYSNGTIESHISSPVMEQKLKSGIQISAASLFDKWGIESKNLEFDVSQNGKIIIANLPDNEVKSKEIQDALEMLNNLTKTRSADDISDEKSLSGNPVAQLRNLLARYDVYLPGGAKDIGLTIST